MAVTVTLYDHTTARYLSGANAVGDTYIINLYSTLPANATATTKALAEVGATQIATANGYTQDTKTISGLAVTALATSNANLDATDVSWDASGTGIEATHAMVYNGTDANSPPVLRIDFGATITAAPNVPFLISWNEGGIFTLSKPA